MFVCIYTYISMSVCMYMCMYVGSAGGELLVCIVKAGEALVTSDDDIYVFIHMYICTYTHIYIYM